MILTKLREVRRASQFDLSGLALVSGVQAASIVRAEAGHSISPRSAQKLADAFGVSLDDLGAEPAPGDDPGRPKARPEGHHDKEEAG